MRTVLSPRGRRQMLRPTVVAWGCCAAVILSTWIPAPLLAAGAALPEWAAKPAEGAGPVRVAVAPPAGKRFAHLAWPKAIRTKDGTIVLAFLAGTFHGGAGSPAVSISTDGGKTFTPPNVLREFGKDKDYGNSGNLAVVQAEDGAIVLLAMAHTERTNNIFGWRSTDSGKTWVPTDTSSLGPNKTGSVTSLIHSPGIGLIAAGHYRAGTKEHSKGIWFAISRDQGRSWADPSPITDVNGGEPVMVQAGDRLLVFIRSRDVPQSKQYLAVSDDKGKTWKTELTEIGVERTGTLAHPFAMLNPEKSSELVILTCERSAQGRIILWQGETQKIEVPAEIHRP